MQTQPAYPPSPVDGIVTLTARRIGKTWTEKPFDELAGGPTLIRSCVINRFEGGIEGESWEEYLMVCQSNGSGTFVSLERIIGRVNGRTGSFVVQGIGAFEKGIANGELTIVPHSGTGELTGIRGNGRFTAPGGRTSMVTLNCELQELTPSQRKP